MKGNKDVVKFIEEYGLTNLARALTEKTGQPFTAQQINHWKKRGVPYRWQDVVVELSGVEKGRLR